MLESFGAPETFTLDWGDHGVHGLARELVDADDSAVLACADVQHSRVHEVQTDG